MAILVDISERNWPAQQNDFPFSLPIGTGRVVVTLTHPDWPAGEGVRVRIEWSDGGGITATLGGGPLVDVQGNPRAEATILHWTVTPPAGITSGVAHIETRQALRSAILVEAL